MRIVLPALLTACDERARELTGRLNEVPDNLQQLDERCERVEAVGQSIEAATKAATSKAAEVEDFIATCTERIDDLGRTIDDPETAQGDSQAFTLIDPDDGGLPPDWGRLKDILEGYKEIQWWRRPGPWPGIPDGWSWRG